MATGTVLSGRPANLAVTILRNSILTGRFKPGDYLPPLRELSRQHGLSSETFRRALKAMEGSRWWFPSRVMVFGWRADLHCVLRHRIRRAPAVLNTCHASGAHVWRGSAAGIGGRQSSRQRLSMLSTRSIFYKDHGRGCAVAKRFAITGGCYEW